MNLEVDVDAFILNPKKKRKKKSTLLSDLKHQTFTSFSSLHSGEHADPNRSLIVVLTYGSEQRQSGGC